jgi:DNA-binding MarR family transcriptional regulator
VKSTDNNAALRLDDEAVDRGDVESLARLAPRPRVLEETGLSESFVADLLAKHLHSGGVLTLRDLVKRVALAGPILERILNFMKREGLVEIRAQSEQNAGLRYALTDRGRNLALEVSMRSGYLGPAPVPLADYARVVRAKTVHERAVTRQDVDLIFDGIVIKEELLDQLGQSMNSGRSIFIYGPAGTGKTFISQRLAKLFHDLTLIPYAILVGDTVVRVFDPMLHKAVSLEDESKALMLEHGHDPRFASCERPVIVVGGELTSELLEVQYDPATRQYEAPLQLKANNGLFLLDDLGRQKVHPDVILNRWIVPMEEHKDYHSLGAGQHFVVPFDEVLIFSTNLRPLDLADEAFLRRIGYKIHFDHLTEEQYKMIWRDVCSENAIRYEPELMDYLINDLHGGTDTPMKPCHPRDLLGIALDRIRYRNQPRALNRGLLDFAWDSYFVAVSNAA